MFTHILSCIVMSSSFNDVTFWKVYLEFQTYSFMYCDVIILQWYHILESLFRIFKHILSCIVMSSSFNDVTFWKVYLESSNIFFHVIVMSSSFNDVTYWNVRLVRVDTSSVLLQYTHTWQSLLSWIFATYLFVFQNNASFKEYGWF